jgi:hypothetical protein
VTVRFKPRGDDPTHTTGDALDRMIAGAVFMLVLVGFVVVRSRRPDLVGL